MAVTKTGSFFHTEEQKHLTPDKQQVYRSLFVCLKACLSRSTHLNGVFSIIVALVDMICITLPLYPTMYVVSPLTYMKGH